MVGAVYWWGLSDEERALLVVGDGERRGEGGRRWPLVMKGGGGSGERAFQPSPPNIWAAGLGGPGAA